MSSKVEKKFICLICTTISKQIYEIEHGIYEIEHVIYEIGHVVC